MTETDTRNGAIGGRLGSRTTRDTTFHGSDPETVAADCISHDTPTQCQARTRLYREGRLVEEGFAIQQISDHLSDAGTTIWLDLRDPDHEDLAVLQQEFGLHPVAIEDALVDRERPKIDRYHTHLFLTAYSARLDTTTGQLATSELAAFILPRALITIRKDDGLDIGRIVDRWDASPDLAAHGVGYLLHGLLDYIVDGHFEAVQSLDDAVEGLEDDLFSPLAARNLQVQRRSFELRKSLVVLRRVVLPMRELLNTLMRRDLRHVDEDLLPYYQDVYDHVLRATEWTELLRDLVTDHPGDEPDDPGQPDERHHQKGDELGGDHRGADVHHRVLRHERALSRLQQPRRIDRRRVDHDLLSRSPVPGLQAQRLAVRRRGAAGTQGGPAARRRRGSRPPTATC